MNLTIKTRAGHFLEDLGILLDVVELKRDENPREYYSFQMSPETAAVTVRCEEPGDCMIQLARLGLEPNELEVLVVADRHVKHPSED